MPPVLYEDAKWLGFDTVLSTVLWAEAMGGSTLAQEGLAAVIVERVFKRYRSTNSLCLVPVWKEGVSVIPSTKMPAGNKNNNIDSLFIMNCSHLGNVKK